jgi:hypothetical protein
MTTRARRAVLMAATLLAVLGVALPAAPASAATAPPKAMVLTATPTATVWSQATKLAVSLTPKGGGQPKGGTLTFRAGDQVLGTAVATKRITTLSTTALPVGEHTVTATYSGDGVTREATSNDVVVTVAPAGSTVALTATRPTVEPGEQAELKAVVRAKGPASAANRPTGTVTFARGTSRVTVAVNASGTATWRPTLAEGTHEITATYNGSDTFGPSTSSAVTQVVAVPEPPYVGEPDAGYPSTQGGLGSASIVAQTFTATRTGLLKKIDIAINTMSTGVNLAVYATDGTFPTGDPLSSQTISSEFRYPELNEFVLATPVPVTSGTKYAFVITPPTTQQNMGYMTNPDGYYTGGSAYLRWPWQTTWDTSYRIDIGFQTWVDPTPIP